MAFVAGPNRGILGQNARNHIRLDVGVGIRGADVGTRQICTHLHLPFAVETVDGRDASLLADFGQLFKGHEAAVRRPDSVPLEVTHGAPVGVVKPHPDSDFVPASLQALDLAPEKSLTHLRQQRRSRHPQLERALLGHDFEFPQAALVVVRDIFEVLPLQHGLFQFVRGRRQRLEVGPQQRHRHRAAEGRKRCEAEVLCAVHRSHPLANHRADVHRPHVAALPIKELHVDQSIVGGGAHPFVHRKDHVQTVLTLRLERLVDLPNVCLNRIQLGRRDLLPRATDHGQVHGEVVSFDEWEERGFDQTAANQSGHGDHEQRHDAGK